MDDEVAQRVDQPPEALLAFLQFPDAVCQRLHLGPAARIGLFELPLAPGFELQGAADQGQHSQADCGKTDSKEVRRFSQPGDTCAD